MGSRAFILVATVVVLLVGGALALYAYDDSRRDLIADGVTVAGVDVGGMKTAAAASKLQETLAAPLERTVRVRALDKTFRLSAEQAEVRTDVGGMVAEALEASRSGNLIERSWRGLTGGTVNRSVRLRINYSEEAVDRLVRRIKRRLDRPARDASVSAGGGGISIKESDPGIAVRGRHLSERVAETLRNPAASRWIRARTAIVEPKVTTDELGERYPWYVIVNRSSFKLTVYRALKPEKTYRIAVGQVGLETPAGLYHIQNKAVNPSWHVPNSEWAGKLAGKVIPPGPENPIKARWMGIYDGAGIHGTDAVASLGTAASHGCIRMAIPDVVELYEKLGVGTPVYIA